MSLSTGTYIPGQSYSFNGAVMQNSESSTKFKLSMEYVDASGTKNYDEIGSATAEKGKWVTIGSDSYTIPEGASDLLLYIETSGSTPDFYFDSASSAKGGTAAKIDLSGAKTAGSEPVVTTVTTVTTTAPTTTTTVTTTTKEPEVPKASLIGDVNESGKVDVSDAVLLARLVAEDSSAKITTVGKLNADTNKSGAPDKEDIILILKYVAKMISAF